MLHTAWLPRAATLARVLALAVPFARAQADYPNKPIRVVVTFPPGGSADGVVRMLLPRLNDKLGQQVVDDNRPGAGGNIGLALVDRLNAKITAALRDDAIQASMRAQGVEPAPATSEAFESTIRSETAKWARVIKTANIKIE